MISLSDKAPSYLFGKLQMVYTVTFTALFSMFFFVVTLLSSDGPWSEMPAAQVFNFCLLFFFIALLAVIVDKRLQYVAFKKRPMSFGAFLLWDFCEAVFLAILYYLACLLGSSRGLAVPDTPDALLILRSIVYTVLCLGIPYIISGMYFALQDRDNIIRMINYANVVSDEAVPSAEEQKITLFDNNGVLKLSVSASNLYYIESDDNYIKVWYKDEGDVLKQYMLRCRLKTVEESWRDSELVRCHRKYIVNMSKVTVLSKERGGYYLNLGSDLIDPIPVTRTYEESVLARFNSR